MELSVPQKEYGEEVLKELSMKYEISKVKMAKILLGTKDHTNFWNWVNAEVFLELYIEEN